MDADRFDILARSLTAAGSRRAALAVALSGALGVLGLTDADDATASGKCKPKCAECKKCKKGTNGKEGKCKKKPNGTACTGGTCRRGTCCVPESAATTCAGALCGTTRTNPCGQAVACGCPSGKTCLLNGTCARPCTSPEACQVCGPGTNCSQFTTEGTRNCAVAQTTCDGLQSCTGTAMCPAGTHCQGCGFAPNVSNRCIPVASCDG
jgi:hypothetical protein